MTPATQEVIRGGRPRPLQRRAYLYILPSPARRAGRRYPRELVFHSKRPQFTSKYSTIRKYLKVLR